jgi:hypothetical protein
MRIVTLGFAMPSAQVDNHSIANAPTLFEYDACLIDPRALSQQIEAIAAGASDLRRPDGTPVQAGASGAFRFGLGELLEQRAAELRRLLARGGVVVVMSYPNVPHPVVSTLPGSTRYTVLPAPVGVSYRPPQLVPGDGGGVRALDPRHAFAGYLQDFSLRITYRARWETSLISDFESIGRVFGRSEGGADVAVDFQVGPGRVIFLPPTSMDLRGAQRRPLTESLVEGITRALETPPEEAAPSWVQGYALPGLAEAEDRLQAAEAAFAEAESQLAEARAFEGEAGKYRGLLWQEGRFGFEALARDALRALGFEVETDLGRPAKLRHRREGGEETTALLEVDASAGTVDERSYLGLQRRIEEEFLRSGKRRKGVIVVNGERKKSPTIRKSAYSDMLENACANFGYALITGETLFALVAFSLDGALEGADAETLASIRETILSSEGLLAVEESDEGEAGEHVAGVEEIAAEDVETAEERGELVAAPVSAGPEGGG